MQDETYDAYHEGQLVNDANFAEHQANEHAMGATSILALMDTTKAQRKSFALQILAAIEDGQVSPLLIHCQLKATENLIKQLTDAKEGKEIAEQYKVFLLDEAAKYGKSFDFHSGSFTVKEAGHKYDWSQCGDADLLADMVTLEALAEKIKTRQEFIKKLPKEGLQILDEDTGELIILYPPAVASTTTVAVTLK